MRRQVLATSVLFAAIAVASGCGREGAEPDSPPTTGTGAQTPAAEPAPPGHTPRAESGQEAADRPAEPAPAPPTIEPPEPVEPPQPAAPFDLDQTLARAAAALEAGQLTTQQGESGAIELYRAVLAEDEDNASARAGLDRAADALVARVRQQLAAGEYGPAVDSFETLAQLRPQDPAIAELQAGIDAARALSARLERARELARLGRHLEPAGENAVALYREILQENPGEPAALAGLVAAESELLTAAAAAATAGDYVESDRLLAHAGQVRPGSEAVQNAGTRIVELRQRRAAELEAEFSAALEQGRIDHAEQLLAQLSQVSAQAEGLEEMRQRVDNARYYGGHSPGHVFQDLLRNGNTGPELVVVPRGSFQMGSPRGEKDRNTNEGPQHEVAFARGFALGRYEVTVGEFRAFVVATGYRPTSVQSGASTIYDERTGTMTERRGVNWQDDHAGRRADASMPVIHVSWTDARAYADWLARESGKRYRLPSEVEFEYALRAGGDTRFPWGADEPMRVVGNLTGSVDRSASGRHWVNAFSGYGDGHWGPAPVGSFPANRFGLHDMAGNVSEWIEDCWHDSYRRAPGDGSAWVNPGCPQRVVRGGSWASAPDQTRSAFRIPATPSTLNARLGFRIARDL
ncbi:MAG TPA: SUMF1/EgtB/PvdO family nonheme iron enzyme [Xanthomonadaceae bacterium]|nr:SUMF1/EgtB/PvdO family nonheme iron enzyme [Xanthomonadaceae bacterium]